MPNEFSFAKHLVRVFLVNATVGAGRTFGIGMAAIGVFVIASKVPLTFPTIKAETALEDSKKDETPITEADVT